MHSTKNATQQLSKSAWPRRQQIIIAGGAPTIKTRRHAYEFSAARPAQRSRPTFIVGHTATTIYCESIWLDPFTSIAFAISTLKNRATFNLSYWMACTRFSLNFRNRSASGASPHNTLMSSASGPSRRTSVPQTPSVCPPPCPISKYATVQAHNSLHYIASDLVLTWDQGTGLP